MAASQFTITKSLLDGFLRCKRKDWLRHEGVHSLPSEYPRFIEMKANQYRVDATRTLTNLKTTSDVFESPSSIQCLRKGRSLVLNVRIEAGDRLSEIDALERVEGDSKFGGYHYQPILYVPSNHIDQHRKMLLAFDGLIISDTQEKRPTHGTIIFGCAFRRSRFRLGPYMERLKPVLQELRGLLHKNTALPVLLNPHCDVCEFSDRCRVDALKSDHLSLLRGMSETEINRNNSKGIFTVHQLSYTFRSRRPSKRAKPAPPPHSYPLQALACREKKLFIHGTVEIPDAATSVYFDFEGLPDRQFNYLFGALICRNGTAEYLPFWADNENPEEAAFESFLESIPDCDNLRLFHYGDYETKALRRMKKRMSSKYTNKIAAIEERAVNIVPLLYHHFYFPVFHNSLKHVAASLGFQWSDSEAKGLTSIIWRQSWEQTGDCETQRRLINYNRDDCVSLRRVTEFLRDALDVVKHKRDDVNSMLAVDTTASLKSAESRTHRFGRFESTVEALNEINQCAYFDYQHEKVFARSKLSKHSARSKKRPQRHRIRPNKTVEVRVKRCVQCRNRKISERNSIKRRIIDLHFGKALVKKWVIDYRSFRYDCRQCGANFLPDEVPDINTKYGHGLVSWCVYNYIVGGRNMLRIRRVLKDVFDLDIPHTAIWRFKKAVRDLVEPFRLDIWKELLKSPVLYVDETEVKLRGMKGYVWVFAGVEHVCFEYRDSREAGFLHELLHGFEGVVVSEFFTGYDSLPMPQQKCLIHLIRDMNEDLRAAPFDEEFRDVVQRFANWLQGVTKTIDRYGLKLRYLRRHKESGSLLFEAVCQQRFASFFAQKYQKRIAKYGDRLLTFADHDFVSWNNNAAEHAIKTFARFRKFANGRFSEASVRELLAIMSVFQTLDLQHVDVLSYLRGLDATNEPKLTVPSESRGFGSMPDEQCVVKRIFAMRRKNRESKKMTYQEIAEVLNSESVPTRRGGRWWGTSVRNVIRRNRRR